MYAVIETGGKQYKVAQGDVIDVEKLDFEVESQIALDKVLLVADGDSFQVGTPYVTGAKIIASVQEHGKGDKIVGFKYKPKQNQRKRYGHRQPFTRLRIAGIELEGKAE